MSPNIVYRKLCEIDSRRLGGVSIQDGYSVPSMVKRIALENPSNDGRDVVVQKLGVVDGRIGGAAYSFPTRMEVDKCLVKSCTGGELSVEDWAKRSGLGFALCDFAEENADGDHQIFEGAGLSQIAVKVHRFMGFKVFEYPRYIMLLKSRALVEQRLSGWVGKVICGVLDSAIALYSLIVKLFYRCSNKGTVVEIVTSNEAAKIDKVAQFTRDGSRFSEVHDSAWFRWMLTCSYISERKIGLCLIKQRDTPIGFFMFKKRFHKQASHRGFKNVNLGSIIEWGCMKGKEKILLWNIVNWVAKQRKKLDAVEFPVYESFAQKFLKRLGWRQVGNANFAYNIRPNAGFVAPEGMDNPANWRLRPAMGDAGLS